MPLSELTKPRGAFQDFKAFLIKQNVFALAIAVVIGVALGSVVEGVVQDLVMPIVAAIGGDEKSTWRTWVTPGPIAFALGDLLARLLNFLIVGFVAWRLAKIFIAPEPASAAPATKQCSHCRMSVDAAATRCAYCTSQL